MSSWLKIEPRRIAERRALILVPLRQGVLNERLIDLFRSLANDDILEEMLRQLVVGARPALKACTIWYVGFNHMTLHWEIGVCHPSLEMVRGVVDCPKIPLLEAEECPDTLRS